MSASNDAGSSQDQRYWFYILAQASPAARHNHAVKLVDKAYQQGDRACIVCDTMQQAQELDELLWNFRPEAFVPHSVVPDSASTTTDPVAILLCPPAADEWDTVILLSATLPADADRFRRLALIAHNDEQVLDQARSQFRQLKALGITPQVHDQRKR